MTILESITRDIAIKKRFIIAKQMLENVNDTQKLTVIGSFSFSSDNRFTFECVITNVQTRHINADDIEIFRRDFEEQLQEALQELENGEG